VRSSASVPPPVAAAPSGVRRSRCARELAPLQDADGGTQLRGRYGGDRQDLIRSIPAEEAHRGRRTVVRTVPLGEMRMTALEVRVTVAHGTVPRWGRRHLAKKIGHVASLVTAPGFAAEATLAVSNNPAISRPVTASAVVDIDGRPVRAQMAAADVREAADLLAARLQRGLEHHAERRRIHRRGAVEAVPGKWRHGMLRHKRPCFRRARGTHRPRRAAHPRLCRRTDGGRPDAGGPAMEDLRGRAAAGGRPAPAALLHRPGVAAGCGGLPPLRRPRRPDHDRPRQQPVRPAG
jgi:ribosome-associated translation inhibitor RaiA